MKAQAKRVRVLRLPRRMKPRTLKLKTPDGVITYELAGLEGLREMPHRGLSLRVLAFSDYRLQDIDKLICFMKAQRKPHLVLYAGDDIGRFRPTGRNLFEEIAQLSAYGICVVAGNDESPDSRTLITGGGVHPVHSWPLVLGQFAVVGLEGAPCYPRGNPGTGKNLGRLLYPESFRAWLTKGWQLLLDSKKLIVLSHAPPLGTLDSSIRFGAGHIGCQALADFLSASSNAVLCVCGHSHYSGGKEERLGGALVVNAASHDSRGNPGKVAAITIEHGRAVSVEWHFIR